MVSILSLGADRRLRRGLLHRLLEPQPGDGRAQRRGLQRGDPGLTAATPDADPVPLTPEKTAKPPKKKKQEDWPYAVS